MGGGLVSRKCDWSFFKKFLMKLFLLYIVTFFAHFFLNVVSFLIHFFVYIVTAH